MTLGQEAKQNVDQAAASPWIDRLARAGLAARGFVYVLIGLLAVQVALGHGQPAEQPDQQTNQNGALRAVAEQPFGKVLLWALAVGFAGYALWRFLEVAYGEVGGDDGIGGRLKCLVRGLAYASLAFTTVTLVTGAGRAKGGSAGQSQTLTARAMSHTGGRLLVGAVGLVLVGVGIAMVVEGVKRKFLKYLKLSEMTAHTRDIVVKLGMVGTAARGLVFALSGYFVVSAAVTFDPEKARGLDGALKSLVKTPLGPWLLIVVALGLVAFGVYGLAEARYRQTSDDSM